jgi:hypothetical protein
MSFFTETIAASLQGRVVRAAYLVKLDFVTEPWQLWNGEGVLETSLGNWYGIGGLGTLDGIEQAIAGTAPEARLGLSGIDSATLQIASEDFDAEAKNRPVTVYMQFFEEDSEVPLDDPYPIWAGVMMRPEFAVTGSTRDIVISGESIFMLRSRPNFAMYTDSDQKRRYPGDRGFEFVAGLRNKVVTWPDY